MLNIIDEFTHECLAIRIDRKLKSVDVIDVLSDLFILRGVPERLRSDNGPEFVAKAVQDWIAAVGAKAAYIAPGSPGERLHRELQRSAPGRAAEWGDFLFARGGRGSWSKAGGATTTPNARTRHRATSLQRLLSIPAFAARRLRNPGQLRRPR